MVVIEYDLQKDWNGPFVHPLQFHPIITPDYFEFTGTNALVQLRLDDSALETGNFRLAKIAIHMGVSYQLWNNNSGR